MNTERNYKTNTRNTMDGIKTARVISAFVNKVLAPKLDELKGINYKTAFRFFAELNESAGFEVVKFSAEKEMLHYYKVKNRLRYDDIYKEGYRINVQFLNATYNGHTKDQYAALSFGIWIKDNFKNCLDVVKNIRESVK